MNQTNYSVMPASPEQRQYIFDNLLTGEYYQKYRESSIIFVSVDESGKIIGRIVARAKDDPLNSWYIDNLRVRDDYKRRGIGTALFRALQKAALAEGVKDLHGFAEATVEASRFWESCGFCFSKFGKVTAKGRDFGNYTHYMFRNPEELICPAIAVPSGFRIVQADRETLDLICGEYLDRIDKTYPVNKEYFKWVSFDLFAFVALDDSGNIAGFALMKHEPLSPPFSNMSLIVWIHVIPEMRRRGIGSALMNEVLSYARSIGTSQVLHRFFLCEEDTELPFWQHLNFHVHFHLKNAAGQQNVLAGMLI